MVAALPHAQVASTTALMPYSAREPQHPRHELMLMQPAPGFPSFCMEHESGCSALPVANPKSQGPLLLHLSHHKPPTLCLVCEPQLLPSRVPPSPPRPPRPPPQCRWIWRGT